MIRWAEAPWAASIIVSSSISASFGVIPVCTLAQVDWGKTWCEQSGNADWGLAKLNARIDEACERAGRDPGDVRRSACLLVAVDGGAGERRAQREAPPLGSDELPSELEALAQAGADEAILVLDPITEPALRSLRTALPSG